MGGPTLFRARVARLVSVLMIAALSTLGVQILTQSTASAAPATGSFSGGVLTIVGDSTANSLTFSCSGGLVSITNASVTPSAPPCASVARISINTGDGNDTVDLQAVVPASFTSLFSANAIDVDLGAGSDTLVASSFVEYVVKRVTPADASNITCTAAGANTSTLLNDTIVLNSDSAAEPIVDTTGSSSAPVVTVRQPGYATTTTTSCASNLAIRNAGNDLLRGGQLRPVSPYRVLDSRAGSGYQLAGSKVYPGQKPTAVIAGTGTAPNNVPSVDGVSAVILNVTATDVDSGGWLKVYPSDAAEPTVSSLNVQAGETRANNVTVKLGSDGQVRLEVLSPMNIVIDVLGYYTSNAVTVTPTGHFESLSPIRVFDTRPGDENYSEYTYGAVGPIGGGSELHVNVADNSTADVPSLLGDDISAVVLNVTVISAGAPGYVTVYPRLAPRPTASNINVAANAINPNLVVVPVGAFGDITMFTQNPAHLLADIVGYFTSTGLYSSGRFQAMSPERFFDSRDASWGNSAIANPFPWGVSIGGRSSIPSTASAVVANVTAVPANNGFVSVFPADSDLTLATQSSSLNMVVGKPVANAVWSELSTGAASPSLAGGSRGLAAGEIGVHVSTAAWIIVDVAGWFTAA